MPSWNVPDIVDELHVIEIPFIPAGWSDVSYEAHNRYAGTCSMYRMNCVTSGEAAYAMVQYNIAWIFFFAVKLSFHRGELVKNFTIPPLFPLQIFFYRQKYLRSSNLSIRYIPWCAPICRFPQSFSIRFSPNIAVCNRWVKRVLWRYSKEVAICWLPLFRVFVPCKSMEANRQSLRVRYVLYVYIPSFITVRIGSNLR